MGTVIKQARSIISSQKYKFKLPVSLYALIINFLNGGKIWYDYNNVPHNTNLNSGGLKTWIDSNSTLHPISSPQYCNEIQDFRKTVRVFKPVLPELISSVINKTTSLQNLHIKTEKLDKADFYTNVNRFINYIIGKVLKDIAQRNSVAEVAISYQRSSWNEYRLCKILITHMNSEANTFDDVKENCSQVAELYMNLLKIVKVIVIGQLRLILKESINDGEFCLLKIFLKLKL